MKISGFSQLNNSGLCRVKYTEVSKVKSISHPDENYEVEIELNTGHEFDEIYFTPAAEDLSIDQKQDDSGTWYEVTAKLVNPYLSAAKSVFFKDLEHKDLVCIIDDNNGKSLLVGSVDKPARLSYKMSVPGSGRNQRQVIIDAIHDSEPYFVATETTDTGDSYDKGFSSGFPSEYD